MHANATGHMLRMCCAVHFLLEIYVYIITVYRYVIYECSVTVSDDKKIICESRIGKWRNVQCIMTDSIRGIDLQRILHSLLLHVVLT